MQQYQPSVTEIDEIAFPKYGIRQRLLSGSLSLAVTSSAAVTAGLAHAPMPTFAPHTGVTTPQASSFHAATPVPLVQSLHPVVNSNASHGWHASAPIANFVAATPGATDINMANAAAMYNASSLGLAGFNTLTLNIGGKQTVIDASSHLTGAELVAAQQVLSGGKQTLRLNADGVATGGTVNLNGSTLSALGNAVGGTIGNFDVAHGVTVTNSVANLNLGGSFVNLGRVNMGGNALDTISATNIANAGGAYITSAPSTSIGLNASGNVTNEGVIASGANLNISSPVINNSGTMSAAGNVNLAGLGGNLAVNNAGGTIQAGGNINMDTSAANGNIAASGGNWLSQNLNFNAGAGTVNIDVGDLTGAVNGSAGCAHVSAATADLQLGDMNITGDPTFYNTAGNISITGTSAFATDVAVVASGNIIGGGGKLDTNAANKAITLIAGANFTAAGGSSVTDTSGVPVASTVTITDSPNVGKGSKTGGFIDLSGSTLGKGTPVTAIDSGNGDILMVAYKGSGTNSGSIIGTGTTKSGGASAINAGTGTVTMIGGGAQITAQNINAKNVTILGTTPLLTGGTMDITDGTIKAGDSYITTPTTFTNTAVNLTKITSGGGTFFIGTAGKTSGTSKVPLQVDGAGAGGFNLAGSTSSLFVDWSNGPLITQVNDSNVSKGATLSINDTTGTNFLMSNIAGSGNIILNGNPAGDFVSAGGTVITANSLTFNNGGVGLNTAVNTLSGTAPGGSITINETASSGKVLNVTGLTPATTLDLTSAQPIAIKGAVTSGLGSHLNITETGSGNSSGISIGGTITAGGTLTLSTTGTDSITATKTVAAANLTINAGGAVGTTAAGLPTNVTTALVLNGNTTLNSNPLINIKDANAGTFTVSGARGGNQQSVTITSAAKVAFNVGQLAFTNVTLTDSQSLVPTNLNAGAGLTVGDGTGLVKITSNGSIVQGGAGNIAGTSANLTSSAGNVGAKGAEILVAVGAATANATKGNVFLIGQQNMTINAGKAVTDYSVQMATGTSVTIGGTLNATSKTGTVTVEADVIAQGPLAAQLAAPNVTLRTKSATGQIGLGAGAQSIQTKATTSLSIISATGGSATAFVTQNGNLTTDGLSVMTGKAGDTLNLFMSTGSKLTVGNTIAWDTSNITAPLSLTVNAPGTIQGTNVTITSPTVALNGTKSVDVTGSASFASSSFLNITGGAGNANLAAGASLSLSGQTAITLGTNGTNDPLATAINSGTLSNLTIFTKGIFTGAYTFFTTDTAAKGDSLSVTAQSLKNSGPAAPGPFVLTSNNVTLSLTGNYALNPAAGANNYQLVSKTDGSFVSATATGTLTVFDNGVSLPAGKSTDSITLVGSKLDTSNMTSSTYFTGDNNFTNVTLGSTAGGFIVGGNGTNGIQGGATATKALTITSPVAGLTVNDGFVLTGDQVTLNTTNFKLNGNSQVVGKSAASTLTISSTSGLTVGGTGGTNNIGGTYTNFGNATLQATNGSVNAGNLFTNLNGAGNMLDNSLQSLIVSATGNVAFSPSLGTLSVSPTGTIFIGGASVSAPNSVKAGQGFLTLSAPGGTAVVNLTNAFTIGKQSGNIDISVGAGGNVGAISANGITLNEVQNVANASFSGNAIAINQNLNATGAVSLSALGNPLSAITEAPGVVITGLNAITLAQGLQTLPTTPLNISTSTINLVSGALSLNNNFAGNVFVGQSLSANPLLAVSLVNTTGQNGKGGSILFIGSMFATAGGINIVNNNGNVQTVVGSTLQTSAGNILVPVTPPTTPPTFKAQPSTGGGVTIQNNDKSGGTIFLDAGTTISTFSTVPGGGQVNIVMGNVPTSGLLAGSPATPNPTINTVSNGGQIFLTTTANPTGTITSVGFNFLNAKGTNIVMNGNGNNGAITLNGVSITADPVVPAAPASATSTASLVNTSLSAPTAAGSVNALAPIAAPSVMPQTSAINWSLPGSATVSANLGAISSGAAGVSDGTIVSGYSAGTVGRTSTVGHSGTSKVLTGGVSNSAEQQLGHGASLMAPKSNTVYNTDAGSVSVAGGSVVLLMSTADGLAVYNLHDTKNGAVKVIAGGRVIKLSPGQNAVLTKKNIKTFEEVNPLQVVAYRNMVAKDWGAGVKTFQSEFNMLGMLGSISAFREMARNTDVDTRKTFEAILKTSVILGQLGGAKYEYMVDGRTAMALTK